MSYQARTVLNMKRIILAILTVIAAIGPVAGAAQASTEGDRVTLRVYSVYPYVNLTFTDEYGDTEKLGNRTLNSKREGYWTAWSKFYTATPYAFDSVEVSDTTGRDDAWVRCFIYVNGTLKYKRTGRGTYASAYC